MKILLLTCLAFIMPANAIVNQYKVDYQRILDSYKKHASISFSITYNNFSNAGKVKPDTSISGNFYMKGHNYDYKMPGSEVMRNGIYYIAVNNYLKTIAINDASNIKGDFLPVSSIDSTIGKMPVAIKYSEQGGGKTGIYKIDADDKQKPFSSMQMVFDKQSYLIQKMILFVADNRVETYYGNNGVSTNDVNKPRVDCIYGNYQFDKVDDQLFETERFIRKDGNEFKPVGIYAKYKVVSLIPGHAQRK